MRTTVDLPDDILAVARELSRQERRPLGAVLASLVRDGLAARTAAESQERRHGLRQLRAGRQATAADVPPPRTTEVRVGR